MTPSLELKKEGTAFPKTDPFFAGLLAQYPQYFDALLREAGEKRAQIIYTQIDRSKSNKPRFTHYYYNVDPERYFYPASTVKMPGAVLALQKLNELGIPGLDKNTMMISEAAGPGLPGVYNEPTSEDGRPTIAHYIKKIFLISDNDAYNRLYEFLGQEYLNNSLHRMGYDSVRLLHRLQVSLTEEQNRLFNPVRFYDTSGNLIYQQPLRKSSLSYPSRQILMGKGYWKDGKLVNAPFDFSRKNKISLPDLHSILQSILFPESVPARQRFRLTEEDYRFLYKYMSMLPRESRYPPYGTAYEDASVKFLLFGGKGTIDRPGLRLFNKIGDAYGFLQDVAYIVDFDKGVEFLLSASIYCNSDGVFNDDHYDYDTVGFPFLQHLGQVIYDYELTRKKKHLPDLSKFRLDYTQ